MLLSYFCSDHSSIYLNTSTNNTVSILALVLFILVHVQFINLSMYKNKHLIQREPH